MIDAMPGDLVEGVRVVYATSEHVRLADDRTFRQAELGFISGGSRGVRDFAKFAAPAFDEKDER